MTEAPTDSAASQVPSNAVAVAEYLTCTKCGYALKGLASAGICPECGKPIAESLPTFFTHLPAETREAVARSLSRMSDCLLLHLFTLVGLFILAVVASGGLAWIGRLMGVLLIASPALHAMYLVHAHEPAWAAFRQWRNRDGNTAAPIAARVASSSLHVVILLSSLAALFIAGDAFFPRSLTYSGTLVGAPLVALSWFAMGMYFASVAAMLRDFHVALRDDRRSRAAAAWRILWPVIWVVSLPLAIAFIGVAGIAFVLVSVSSWLRNTAQRVRKAA
jgi:hypothetical protein